MASKTSPHSSREISYVSLDELSDFGKQIEVEDAWNHPDDDEDFCINEDLSEKSSGADINLSHSELLGLANDVLSRARSLDRNIDIAKQSSPPKNRMPDHKNRALLHLLVDATERNPAQSVYVQLQVQVMSKVGKWLMRKKLNRKMDYLWESEEDRDFYQSCLKFSPTERSNYYSINDEQRGTCFKLNHQAAEDSLQRFARCERLWIKYFPERPQGHYGYHSSIETHLAVDQALLNLEPKLLLRQYGDIAEWLPWVKRPKRLTDKDYVLVSILCNLRGEYFDAGLAQVYLGADHYAVRHPKTEGLILSHIKPARPEVMQWIQILHQEGRSDLPIPRGQIEGFCQKLSSLTHLRKGIEVSADLPFATVQLKPSPWIRILIDPNDESITAEAFFDYLMPKSQTAPTRDALEVDVKTFGAGDKEESWLDHKKQRTFERNLDEEGKLYQHLNLGRFASASKERPGLFQVPHGFVGALIDHAEAEGWKLDFGKTKLRRPQKIKVTVKSGINWFDSRLSLSMDDEDLGTAMPEILKAARMQRPLILSKDGFITLLNRQQMDEVALVDSFGMIVQKKGTTPYLKVDRFKAGLLTSASEGMQSISIAGDRGLEQLRKDLSELKKVRGTDPREGFQAKLRPYQREGLGWLERLQSSGFGGCLADDMGLGKTVQVLAQLDRFYGLVDKKSHRPSLIVVPKSLIFNWLKEAEKFAPQLRLAAYEGSDRGELLQQACRGALDGLVMTYAVMTRDIEILTQHSFAFCILDEAQAIKNRQAKMSLAAKGIIADYHLAMTGTPVENHLGELASIMEFLNPGIVGSQLHKTLCNPKTSEAMNPQHLAMLREGLRPFILRRCKSQVLTELPEKTESVVYCELSEEERKHYEQVKEFYRKKIAASESLAQKRMLVLEGLMRLRQLSCHPALLSKEIGGKYSTKTEVLVDRLQNLHQEGHRCLVFSQFTSLLKIVAEHLKESEISYLYLDGQTRDRHSLVERFQSEQGPGVFLISLKAGGTGLNLTAASYCYILDPWWNPAAEAQAIDRSHRIGQNNHVFAYKLIAKDTVEEKILDLQAKKRELAEHVIGDDVRIFKHMSQKEIELLFS